MSLPQALKQRARRLVPAKRRGCVCGRQNAHVCVLPDEHGDLFQLHRGDGKLVKLARYGTSPNLKPTLQPHTNEIGVRPTWMIKAQFKCGAKMHPSHVYFLVGKDNRIVKIGKANSVECRVKQLGLQDVDLNKSMAFQVPSAFHAYMLEGVFREALSSYRMTATEVATSIQHKSGRTEWYDVACLPKAKQLITRLKNLIAFEMVKVVFPKTIPINTPQVHICQGGGGDRAAMANALNAENLPKFNSSLKKLRTLCMFTGVMWDTRNYFQLYISIKNPNRRNQLSECLTDLKTHGIFHYPAGGISLLDYVCLSDNIGYFKVYVDKVRNLGCNSFDFVKDLPRISQLQLIAAEASEATPIF